MFDSLNNYLLALDQSFFRCPWQTLRNLVNIKCNLKILVIFIYLLCKIITQLISTSNTSKQQQKETLLCQIGRSYTFVALQPVSWLYDFSSLSMPSQATLLFLEVDSVADKVVNPTNSTSTNYINQGTDLVSKISMGIEKYELASQGYSYFCSLGKKI